MRAARSATWLAATSNTEIDCSARAIVTAPSTAASVVAARAWAWPSAQPALGEESRKVAAEVAEDGPRVAHVLLILAGHPQNRATKPRLGLGSRCCATWRSTPRR
jgi:hypothetical protein